MITLSLPDGPLALVCLAAHPDDLEIGCGGTLLTLSARGDVAATVLTLTGAPEREVEASGAAQAFLPGAVSRFARLRDGRLPAAWDAVKDALHDLAADVPRPDVVLAPSPHDAHQDHRLVGSLAPTVWRDSLVLYYEIPKWDGDMGRPTVYVPVADELAARKVELLDEHYGSQHGRQWWDRETFLGLMRLRGMECRSHYAEAFATTKTVLGLGQGLGQGQGQDLGRGGA
ncbi:MAG TPA: PIG-L deacetylase family protein [Cellulomonas sp.]